MPVPTGWLRKGRGFDLRAGAKSSLAEADEGVSATRYFSRPRRSSGPAKPAPRTHGQDWSETRACSLRSSAPARRGQMRLELKKVQRSSATRSLLGKRSLPGSRSYGGPGSQDGCARRHSASRVPYFTHEESPDRRNYIPGPGFPERSKAFIFLLIKCFVLPEYRGILLARGAWSSTPLDDLEQPFVRCSDQGAPCVCSPYQAAS